MSIKGRVIFRRVFYIAGSEKAFGYKYRKEGYDGGKSQLLTSRERIGGWVWANTMVSRK
ncbi:hypothetical protein [Flavobacterium sp. ZS1P14]|uniref:hypothetical protein n=1 Tax=Flavobacterium sp. ZS1P14 TaxID=3401729 RepID=UPI003AADCC3A